MSNTPRSLEDLRNEARRLVKIASGTLPVTSTVPEKDPNEQGVVTIPNHPDGDDKRKLQIPEGEPTTAAAIPDGVSTTNPAGASQGDIPSTRDGNAVDARFTEPNTPLSKIAQTAKQKLQQIQALAAKTATAAPSTPTGVTDKPANMPAKAPKTETPAVSADTKCASTPPAPENVDGDYCQKLAYFLLTSENGIERVEEMIKEEEGAKVAATLLDGAKQMRDERLAWEQALNEEALYKQAAIEMAAQELDAFLRTQPEDVQDQIVKASRQQMEAMEKLDAEHPDLVEAYRAGREESGKIVMAMAMGEEEPTIEGSGEELTPEQIAEVIQNEVAAGKMDPALAEQLLALLLSGDGGEAQLAPEGDVPPEALEEAAPEEAKLASFRDSLLAA